MLIQLDTENADRNITSSITVLTHTPDADIATWCQGFVLLGDGNKDLDGTGGIFELVITVGGQTIQPSPQSITFGTEGRSAVWSTPFPVHANAEVIMKVKSPNAADSDVDVTAYLYDLSPQIESGGGVNVREILGLSASVALEAAVDAELVSKNLDHLMKTAVANNADMTNEVTDGTVLSNIMSKTSDTSSFTVGDDSLEAIRDNIVAASPQTHAAESSNDTTGDIDSGTYADTATINNTYWQISPETPAVNGFGLNVDLVFDIGTGLDRVPSSVNIEAYFDSNPTRVVHVWVYNYETSSWDQRSDSGSAILNGSSNSNYQYSLQNAHIQTSDGEVKIRFTATSTTVGDVLFLDFVAVSSVAVEAAGLTAEAIAQAVHAHDVSEHTDHDSAGFRIAMSIIDEYPITTSDSATSFTCSSLPATTNNYYQCHRVRVHDVTNDRFADSWIASMDNSGVVILGRALPFTPDTAAELYVMNIIITPAEIQTQLEGSGTKLTFIKDVVEGDEKFIAATGIYTVKTKGTETGLIEKQLKDTNGDNIDSVQTVITQTGETP